jgi:hypothetical protein
LKRHYWAAHLKEYAIAWPEDQSIVKMEEVGVYVIVFLKVFFYKYIKIIFLILKKLFLISTLQINFKK